MKAYTNTLKTKQDAVALAQWHQDQDKFIKGEFWSNEYAKGCSVGCMVHEYKLAKGTVSWHAATEPLYGIPRALSCLQDRIFEGLPLQDAKLWTVRFMTAIPEGKDLSMVIPKFLYWILTDPEGIIKHARPDGLATIIRVSDLFKRKIDGDEPKINEWRKARAAAAAIAYAAATAATAAADGAAAAVAYAAYASAAVAYAAYASAAVAYDADADAYAVAYAAAHAADVAAYAAATAAAGGAAAAGRSNFYVRMADKLIEITGENK